MGLGKSFTTIMLLHTVLTSPAMRYDGRQLFHKVLLVVPVNALANWEDEVIKWNKPLCEKLKITNLARLQSSYKVGEVDRWNMEGGIMLLSPALLHGMITTFANKAQPDILIVDEAHTMLKSSNNQVYKSLERIRTKRRILLTGTPLQNNVIESFDLVEFVKPGIFGTRTKASDIRCQ
jgi:SNF2 family DNA or RNA helicase